jgi:rhamnosyltransferase
VFLRHRGARLQHVFIIGSKGIPAQYGGYETFVDKLTENQMSNNIQYHVACAVDDASDVGEFDYNGAHCFKVLRRPIGAAQAITYDIDAFAWCLSYIEKNRIEHPIVYVLACRIGPFVGTYAKRLHNLGGMLLVNPDGHEWMRAKWSAPVRKYWKISEKGMVKHADLLVCDSKNIERYIHEEYAALKPETTFIAYGADVRPSSLADDDQRWTGWLEEHGLKPFGYYLVVGRFVPENNYETMIREFMQSDTKRDFALVTNVNDQFLDELEEKTHFRSDPRVKFVGTVYDQELLKKVRENAYGYFHGHEVGGTNPSLLEALASTRLNLLLDVGFNREVAEDSALYWTKDAGNLAGLIERADALPDKMVEKLAAASTKRIEESYSWRNIIDVYETLFLTMDGE